MRDCEQMNRWARGVMTKQLRAGLKLSVLGVVMLISTAVWAETPGEHFEKAMKRLAENCAKAKKARRNWMRSLEAEARRSDGDGRRPLRACD